MPYCSASDVRGLCHGLSGSESAFSESTRPSLSEVNKWLSSGCGVIETRLTSWGYDVPPAQNTAIWDALSDLNALFAAARAEKSRTTATVQLGERTRGQVYQEDFDKGLKALKSEDLSGAGLTQSSTLHIYAGGISDADKDVIESDTDRVTPRFRREQFRHPGSQYPTGDRSDEDDDE